jgi:hypothetical protein
MTNFSATISELERLLNFRLIHGHLAILGPEIYLGGEIRKKQPLHDYIELIIKFHNTGNVEFRQYGLARIDIFISDLQKIESFDVNLLKHFQRLFKRCNGNTYWGLRFEIDLAATLIQKGIKFTKGDFLPGGDHLNADFRLDDIAIECGSTRDIEVAGANSRWRWRRQLAARQSSTFNCTVRRPLNSFTDG